MRYAQRVRGATGGQKMRKPFRVNSQWIDYAHGPGAEDGQPLAVRLTQDLHGDSSHMLVADRDLVEEIVDVAKLYTSHSNVQDDDRLWFRGYPKSVIKRGEAWLRAEVSA